MSSPPNAAERLDVTIKLNPFGTVSRYLFDNVTAGKRIRVKGAQGGFFFDPDRHKEPLVLVSAGSGITPMMSIVRSLRATNTRRSVRMLYGARTEADVIFHDECHALSSAEDWFDYRVSLSQPDDSWTGRTGRIDAVEVLTALSNPGDCRFFLCGPADFMDAIRSGLMSAGVDPAQIHTEQFHKTTPAAVGS